jgi:hypothetical protein
MEKQKKIPKFFYSIFLLLFLLWGGLIAFVLTVSPSKFLTIAGFLTLLFIALSFTFSLPIYKYRKAKSLLSGARMIYRKSLRWGFFYSFLVTGTLGFKAYDLINPLNYGMFLLLCLGIYFWLRELR